MKLATMLSDVWQSLLHSPVTRQYPLERTATPQRLRGQLHWNPDQCTGCNLCIKDCPADAIELITLDKASKRFVLRYFLDRCTFCGQCVESCRFNCLTLANDQWELASLTKEPFTIYYGEAVDVKTVMDRTTESDSVPQP